MKTDDEMYQGLLSRYDSYQQKKRRRIRIVRRAVPVLACFSLTVALGIGYGKYYAKLPEIPVQQASVPATEQQTDVTEMPAADDSVAVTESSAIRQTDAPAPSEDPVLAEVTEAPSQASVPDPTEPAQRSDDAASAVSETAQPVTEAPTELPEPQPAEPETEQTAPVVEQELDGFRVVNDNGRWFVVSADTAAQPEKKLRNYTLEGWRVELLETWDDVTENGSPIRYYKAAHYDRECIITQQKREDFSIEIPEGTEISIYGENDMQGFSLPYPDDDTIKLFWIRDGEGFCITGEYLSSMNAIINSFKLAE